MRRSLAVLCLAAAAAAQDVSVETVAPDECFVGEPVRLALRIRYDAAFLREHAVQMFARELDVPLQADAPWLDELPGARLRAAPDGGVSVALNGEAAFARRVGADVVEIERTCVALEPGERTLAAPRLRFTLAARFVEDFFGGRTPVDPREHTVLGEAFALRVRPLPEEGRPAGFTGAVGRFTVRSEAAPTRLDAGGALRLVLRIEGGAEPDLFEPPRLDGLEGFHVYGSIDDRAHGVRTVTYELSPLDGGVNEVPAIAFPYFDPEAGAYRTARTEPIPIEVRGGTPPPAATADEGFPTLLVAGAVVAAIAAVLLVLRARRRDRGDPVRDAFLARADADPASAFTEYLAARLGCPAAAVIAPDLRERLADAAVPPDLAARAAALVEGLVAARYGAAHAADAAAARALFEELEAAR